MADRLDRRTVLVVTDLLRVVLALAFVFVRDLAAIYALIFLMGAARALFNPTIRAAFPGVVGEGDLTRANSLIGGTFSVSITVGPALGGILVAAVGVDVAFAVDAATFLIPATLLYRLPLVDPQRDGGDEGFIAELRSGLIYLSGARVPLGIVVGAFLIGVATD